MLCPLVSWQRTGRYGWVPVCGKDFSERALFVLDQDGFATSALRACALRGPLPEIANTLTPGPALSLAKGVIGGTGGAAEKLGVKGRR